MSYPKLTATLPVKNDISNARNYGGEKELVDAKSIIVAAPDRGLHEIVTARWYMGRSREASVAYCSVWVRRPEQRDRAGNVTVPGAWWSGTGTAGGYGYHKGSAALNGAIKSAGITLSRSVSGTGECEEALMAIAKAMYPRLKEERFLVVTH
jgi:hypothetical protein